MPDNITKFIESLDEKTRSLLKKKLCELQENSYKMAGVKKMKGMENAYRLKIGKIRIIYTIHKDNSSEIIDIDYRGNIY